MKEIAYELKIDSRRIVLRGAYGTHVNMIYQYPDQWLNKSILFAILFWVFEYSGICESAQHV